MKNKGEKDGFIKFLGTAGARFVMIKQLRASGGIWINYQDTDIIIDPGPGAIVRCNSSRPKLDPSKLDAIILTHKHLDHSGDINVMIEAMTQGRRKKRGELFIPCDALGEDGVIFSYLKDAPEKITFLKTGKFLIKDISFEVVTENIHSVLTYGLKFYIQDKVISFVGDTRYFDDLINLYKDSDFLILNVVFFEKRLEFQHLCLDEALELIKAIKPKKTILTHFGITMLSHKPHIIEKKLQEELNIDIKLAYDGLLAGLPLDL